MCWIKAGMLDFCLEMVNKYFDDAHEKFGEMLHEQGYASDAEKLQIEILHERSRFIGEEHPDYGRRDRCGSIRNSISDFWVELQ